MGYGLWEQFLCITSVLVLANVWGRCLLVSHCVVWIVGTVPTYEKCLFFGYIWVNICYSEHCSLRFVGIVPIRITNVLVLVCRKEKFLCITYVLVFVIFSVIG